MCIPKVPPRPTPCHIMSSFGHCPNLGSLVFEMAFPSVDSCCNEHNLACHRPAIYRIKGNVYISMPTWCELELYRHRGWGPSEARSGETSIDCHNTVFCCRCVALLVCIAAKRKGGQVPSLPAADGPLLAETAHRKARCRIIAVGHGDEQQLNMFTTVDH